MRIIHVLPVLAATLAAGRNLLIGTTEGCGSNKYGPDWYVWYDDMPNCAGKDIGPVNSYLNYGICDRRTMLNGTSVSFTGCTHRHEPFGQGGPPTGALEDGGRTSLLCVPANFPPKKCPSPCRGNPPVTVTTNYICVPRDCSA
ncbi:hypothetical protein BDV25DRAFT_135728 [Aspergillus avenaceus]|uniref:RlpA-like double-psi beta-barrel-protein domain-containing protein-containing protein n=1 Tax=Aspergillus avenaceus TaxID=36643 RepID=A0A5N6U7F9_ASPAV|nr:hypothetical protein BDV25DRAFT_135728 [Aspergillus avenaceus]